MSGRICNGCNKPIIGGALPNRGRNFCLDCYPDPDTDHFWRQEWLYAKPDPATDVETLWKQGDDKPHYKWWKCEACGEMAHIHWINWKPSECGSQAIADWLRARSTNE